MLQLIKLLLSRRLAVEIEQAGYESHRLSVRQHALVEI